MEGNVFLYVHSYFMCLFTSDLPVDMCPSRRGKKSFTSLLLSSSSSYVLSTDIDMYSQYVLCFQYSNVYHIVHGLHSDNVKSFNFGYNCLYVKFTDVLIHVTVMVHNVHV